MHEIFLTMFLALFSHPAPDVPLPDPSTAADSTAAVSTAPDAAAKDLNDDNDDDDEQVSTAAVSTAPDAAAKDLNDDNDDDDEQISTAADSTAADSTAADAAAKDLNDDDNDNDDDDDDEQISTAADSTAADSPAADAAAKDLNDDDNDNDDNDEQISTAADSTAAVSTAADAAAKDVASDDVELDDPSAEQNFKKERPLFFLQLGVVGRGGATAGHVWSVPAVGPAVGGGSNFKAQFRFHERWTLEGNVSGVLGVADDGSLGGGYKGLLHLRWDWIKESWMRIQSSMHVGITGFLLIPIPTYGLAHKLTFYLVNVSFFRGYIEFGVLTDALLIVPHLGVDLAAGAQFFWGPFSVGFEIRGEADALVAIIANQVTALGVAELTLGFSF